MEVSNHKTHCIVCDSILTGKQARYCSSKCKNKFNQSNNYHQQQLRATKRKDYFVDKAGGKCSVCGYAKNRSALCFHHIDPSTKRFPLDARCLSNRTLKELELEFDKCSLLCLNCHAELHHPKHTIL